MKIINFIITLILILTIFCTQKSIHIDDNAEPALVKTYGIDNRFDIATWNLKEFPLDPKKTLSYMTKIIRNLKIDLYAIQEIKDDSYFYQLVDSLEEYNGIISSSENYLKFGIIYRKDIISITNIDEIYITDYDTLPRAPLLCYLEVKNG